MTDERERAPTGTGRLERAIAHLDRFPGPVFLTGEATISARSQPDLAHHRYVEAQFHRPTYDRRLAHWRRVPDLPDDLEPSTLAARFHFTHSGIEDVLSTARALSVGDLTTSALYESCRLHATADLDELGREIKPTYDWEDLVLPRDTHHHLQEIAASVRNRGIVYDRWGFETRFSHGTGINVLFTGPPGTGKTMAAEVIAEDVGLPLFAIDLAQVVSKYIGETEKNLGRVFDRAAESDAILFFDEADALFGERTEVSDARDRYANVEVDYLLQRIESHDGCVILATNYKENIDDAFERRLDASVDFPRPDEAARRQIWASIFPEETPVGDLDIDFCASFELTGGYIKNVATTAAFMAAGVANGSGGADDDAAGGSWAGGDASVEMDHIVRALRREFQKTGKLFESEIFGEYRDAIE